MVQLHLYKQCRGSHNFSLIINTIPMNWILSVPSFWNERICCFFFITHHCKLNILWFGTFGRTEQRHVILHSGKLLLWNSHCHGSAWLLWGCRWFQTYRWEYSTRWPEGCRSFYPAAPQARPLPASWTLPTAETHTLRLNLDWTVLNCSCLIYLSSVTLILLQFLYHKWERQLCI